MNRLLKRCRCFKPDAAESGARVFLHDNEPAHSVSVVKLLHAWMGFIIVRFLQIWLLLVIFCSQIEIPLKGHTILTVFFRDLKQLDEWAEHGFTSSFLQSYLEALQP